MTDHVAELLRRIEPPTPASVSTPNWRSVETRLGTPLPDDFKTIVSAYGVGAFDDFLWLLQPECANGNLDFEARGRAALDALKELKEQGEDVPFNVSAVGNDLMAWAITDNGDVCYWITQPHLAPDQWTVVVNDGRAPLWDHFEGSTAAFLIAALSGSLESAVFPDDFPTNSPAFKAWTAPH